MAKLCNRFCATRAKNRAPYITSDSDPLVQIQNNYTLPVFRPCLNVYVCTIRLNYTMPFKSYEHFYLKTSISQNDARQSLSTVLHLRVCTV